MASCNIYNPRGAGRGGSGSCNERWVQVCIMYVKCLCTKLVEGKSTTSSAYRKIFRGLTLRPPDKEELQHDQEKNRTLPGQVVGGECARVFVCDAYNYPSRNHLAGEIMGSVYYFRVFSLPPLHPNLDAEYCLASGPLFWSEILNISKTRSHFTSDRACTGTGGWWRKNYEVPGTNPFLNTWFVRQQARIGLHSYHTGFNITRITSQPRLKSTKNVIFLHWGE